jgi:hypothetical protein
MLNLYDYSGVTELKDAIASLSETSVDGIITAFSGKASAVTTSMKSLVNAMVSGLDAGVSGVTGSIKSIMSTIMLHITGKNGDFKAIGKDLITHLTRGIKLESDAVGLAAQNAGTKAASGAGSNYLKMLNAGKYLGSGLVLGISSKKTDAYNAGYALGQAAVQGELDGQQSESPSKAAIQAGKWIGEGLIIGMDRMANSVYNAGDSIGSGTISSISNSIGKISSLIESGIDAQPTIRPVLDLSDVQAGVNTMGSMLNIGGSVGVTSNLGAISTMMRGRGQNGTNNDVVSAIDKLNRKMDNIGNTTYQINGVTYDDGSNIASAVQTITRAALRERRV